MLRALAFAFLAGLAAAAHAFETIDVVATTTDLRALVEAVGGARVRVASLVAPGQDPHAVELRPGQLERLKRAALIVRVGLDHETWLARALRTARITLDGRRDVDASRHVALMQAETPRLRHGTPAHVHGLGNTHYWLDPANAQPITRDIAEALSRLLPAERERFEANRQQFLARLDEAMVRWTEAMAPYRGTRIVVVHESWPYFARRFGLVVVGAVEASPGIPPTPSVMAALPQRMREAGARVLVAEPYSDAAVVRQLAARSGAIAVTLVPSVGADPAAVDYIALFDVNIGRLSAALASTR